MTAEQARILTEAADSVQRNVRCQTHTEANGKANAVDHLRQLAAEALPATGNPSVITDRVLSEVLAERIRQDGRWGEQNHNDGTGGIESRALRDEAQKTCQAAAERGIVTWAHIADEEHCEALAETDPVRLRAELVQAAAVYVAWIEAIDRRTAAATAEVSAETAAPAPATAPLAASQPSEAPVEGETGERASTGRTGDSRRTLTPNEYDAAWHAVEGAAGDEGADPGTVLHAVLNRLGIEWQDAASTV